MQNWTKSIKTLIIIGLSIRCVAYLEEDECVVSQVEGIARLHWPDDTRATKVIMQQHSTAEQYQNWAEDGQTDTLVSFFLKKSSASFSLIFCLFQANNTKTG